MINEYVYGTVTNGDDGGDVNRTGLDLGDEDWLTDSTRLERRSVESVGVDATPAACIDLYVGHTF